MYRDLKVAKTLKVLFVEDHLPDVHLVRRLLNKSKIDAHIDVMFDGEEAIEYLKNNTPDIIFLDINLPKVNGLEILTEIKNDFRLANIPVIILTTSDSDFYQSMSESMNVDAYIQKPLQIDDVYEVLYKRGWIVEANS